MRMNKKTTLKLSRVLSTNASGHEVLNYVNITSVNPEVADADMLAIGQATTLSLTYPREDLTEAEVKKVADTMIAKNFLTIGESSLASFHLSAVICFTTLCVSRLHELHRCMLWIRKVTLPLTSNLSTRRWSVWKEALIL